MVPFECTLDIHFLFEDTGIEIVDVDLQKTGLQGVVGGDISVVYKPKHGDVEHIVLGTAFGYIHVKLFGLGNIESELESIENLVLLLHFSFEDSRVCFFLPYPLRKILVEHLLLLLLDLLFDPRCLVLVLEILGICES